MTAEAIAIAVVEVDVSLVPAPVVEEEEALLEAWKEAVAAETHRCQHSNTEAATVLVKEATMMVALSTPCLWAINKTAALSTTFRAILLLRRHRCSYNQTSSAVNHHGASRVHHRV